MGGQWQDIRFGIRMLTRNPLFTVAAALCLGLGIGANAAMFPFFYEFLLDPLPFEDSKELMVVYETMPERGWTSLSVSYPDYQVWREENHVFTGLAAYDWSRMTLTGPGDPERLLGAIVTGECFDLLGVEPVTGRGFSREDENPGAPAVVLLGNDLWRVRFGADPGITGKTLILNGEVHTVIGIMPRRFAFPTNATLWTVFRPGQNAVRGRHFLDVVGRLKPGISREDAQIELDGISAGIAEEFPDTNRGMGVVVKSMRDDLTEDFREPVSIFYGVVCFVLLLACANVANLLLARAAAREREIAVRVTLGAGRFRVMKQLLTESVLLALLGGTLGIVLGSIGRDLIIRYIPEEIPYYLEFDMNGWVIVILILITTFCGILFGMAPAIEAFRSDLNQILTEGSGRTAGSRRLNWFRSFLVVFEIGLALVILTGAGLMMKGFVGRYSGDPGFEKRDKLTMRISLPDSRYATPLQAMTFFEETLNRLEQLPGVTGVSVVSILPMSGSNSASGITVGGEEPDPEGRQPLTNRRTVTPDYFACMGIPVLLGRDFNDRDRAGAPPVVIVNKKLADAFWPGEDPLGRRIAFAGEPSPDDWLEIVGVVDNVRQAGLNREVAWCAYRPMAQEERNTTYYVLNTGRDPLGMVDPVRRTIWSVDPDLPLYQIRTMDQVVRQGHWEEPLYALLFGIFAIIALVLASVGVYGVVSYSVSQRTREFGIRMALGADSGTVQKLVVGKGALLGMTGIGAGLLVSFACMKVIESLLLGVRHDDPAVYAFAALTMAVVALFASFIPARRATLVDPVETLRAE